MDNQQKPTLWHMELCSVLCASQDGRGAWGRMETCICMAEFLHCSPETITLLNGYTPIQNDFGIKKNNKNKFFLKKNENFCALGKKMTE